VVLPTSPSTPFVAAGALVHPRRMPSRNAPFAAEQTGRHGTRRLKEGEIRLQDVAGRHPGGTPISHRIEPRSHRVASTAVAFLTSV
jgi:hypothetical protein